MVKKSYGIVQSVAEIEQGLMSQLAQQINPIFINGQKELLNGVHEDIIDGLKATVEYDLLVNGRWRGQFGFEKGTERNRLDVIIATIANSVKIDFIPFEYTKGKFVGGLEIKMLIEDYSDILSLKQAVVQNKANIPVDLPWLEWFLTMGGISPPLVNGYHIIFGAEGEKRNRNSRSGIAIMAVGGNWVVPGDGTPNDNWLTRFFTSGDFIDRLGFRVYKLIQG